MRLSAKPSLYWRYAPIYRHPPHHGKTLKKGLDVTLTIFRPPGELINLAGTSFEPSEWMTITQETIDAFAQATGDRQ